MKPWNKGKHDIYSDEYHKKCASYGMLGKHHSKKTKKLMSKLATGKKNPMFGKHFSKESKRKLSESLKGNHSGEKHYRWKGENVGYLSLHEWIRKHKEKETCCERCGIDKPLDISNISGEYKRDVDDYEWLCRHCHMIKDGTIYNLKSMRK
jgi:hypothetical protein